MSFIYAFKISMNDSFKMTLYNIVLAGWTGIVTLLFPRTWQDILYLFFNNWIQWSMDRKADSNVGIP